MHKCVMGAVHLCEIEGVPLMKPQFLMTATDQEVRYTSSVTNNIAFFFCVRVGRNNTCQLLPLLQ